MDRVKLNTAPISEISSLYGIGPASAERILAYRQINGPIETPEQLSKVAGVSLLLARTLAPHIDWGVEGIQEGGSPQLDWRTIALAISILAVLGFLGANSLNITRHLAFIKIGFDEQDLVLFLEGIFGFLADLGVLQLYLALVGWVFGGLMRNEKSGPWSRTFAWVMVIGLTEIIAYGAFVLLIVVGVEDHLTGDTDQLVLLLVIVALLLRMPFRALFQTRKGQVLDWIFRKLTLLASPLLLYAIVLTWNTVSKSATLSDQVWWLLISVFVAADSLLVLRGDQGFEGFLDTLFHSTARQETRLYWKRWINIHLPSEEHQVQLARTLGHMYPRPAGHTVFRLIILGAASWLALSLLGSILEWLVQVVLENFF